MTHYLLSVLADGSETDTEKEELAIDEFNDQMRADGNWVFGGGLAAPSASAVVDARGGEMIVTDGPFMESKELIAGFWVVQAADLDAARKLASQGSRACNRRVELRPFLGVA